MAFKLITLRSLVTEISSSIVSANERLLANSYEDTAAATPMELQTQATPLEIKNVCISFSARVVNRKLTNAKAVRQDEILLDFNKENKKTPNNIYAEMVFSGKGEPIELENWHDDDEDVTNGLGLESQQYDAEEKPEPL